MEQEYVYHASKTRNLKSIRPNISTHNKVWVYAAKTFAFSSVFLGKNNDFICQSGISNGCPFIYERFEGALDYAYKSVKGSIYKLSARDFVEGKTQCSGEVVSEFSAEVVEELFVGDSLENILNLEKQEKIIIYRYPNRPSHAPADKIDIIEKAIKWTIEKGDEILNQIEQYHPDVLEKVIQELIDKGYKPTSERWNGKLKLVS